MSHHEHLAIEALALAAIAARQGETNAPDTPPNATELDYYALLNIAPDADETQIREALQRFSAQELPVATRAALHNARSVLLNADLRARYNASL